MTETHRVGNQPPLLVDYDAAATDPMINSVLTGDRADPAELSALRKLITGVEVQRWAVEANDHPPVLRSHDRFGHRIDEVDFHPSWHRLMELSVSHGLHAAVWVDDHEHAQLRRAAGFYLVSQAEAGHGCPISMTYSLLPAPGQHHTCRWSRRRDVSDHRSQVVLLGSDERSVLDPGSVG